MNFTPPTSSKKGRVFAATSVALAVSAFIVGCGGGGGGSDNGAGNGNGNPVVTPSAITLSGTAATGAPMSGASVVVKDSTGAEVQSCDPCTVNEDGTFSVTLKTSAVGPFVLYVTQDEDADPEVSVIAATQSTTVNVSPITTLIAARLSANGDPVKLQASGLSADKIQLASQEVGVTLKPLLEAAGMAADVNPLTASFKADGTGLDRALDVLGKPNIVRSADGNATVEIEIKTGGTDGADDAAAPKITLAAGVKPVASGAFDKATLTAALPDDGVAPLIGDLLARIEACYATAPGERRPDNSMLGSQITADVCKGLFVGDDPGRYLHNNYVVSQKGASLPAGFGGRFSGAFAGIFGSVQGVKFDLPEYRYTVRKADSNDVANGDVVFTARWTVSDPKAGDFLGQTDIGEYQARKEGGKLKLVGNQSKHDLEVRAQGRREEMPAVADYAYLSTGYNIGIGERRWNHDNNPATPKVSIYEKVVVTSPSGRQFTLKPAPGNDLDYLGLVGASGNVSKSAAIRLSGKYLNVATQGNPKDRFVKEFWASPAWTEEEIANIPSQANWKFEITLTDAFFNDPANNVTSKVFTQVRRTINRAPTLTELSAVKWPVLKDPMSSALAAGASSQGFVAIGSNATPEALAVNGWDVPTGAWAPIRVKAYGTNWDEGADTASTLRAVTIRCMGSGAHCDKSSGANTGKFINAGWGFLQFVGRDSKRVTMSLGYSTRKTESDS